ncbi:phage tail domain-containing protein [Sporosarcina sp. Te-1]|uniref:phage distal tail protein n=1 Tax=Sporosarcina sp. Te-1 TaxID=2818390 RepID=UPI001A9EF4F5|nr:phage tail domain-containing protein [Sporosarcina sp. Te-1]QTD41538.1 phage tail family protein [Sporosarcina sp. Te-1]
MREKLTITNTNGDTVELSHRPPFLLTKIEGLGDVDADVQMSRAPFQDGATHVDTLLEPRYISIQVSILSDSREDLFAFREHLTNVLNPKYSLTVTYENGWVSRQISAISEHVPKYPADNRGLRYQIALANLVCPSPFWQDINPTNIKLEDYVSGFRFPFHFPVRFATRGDTRLLVNVGHAPAPVKITFRGESINPTITKVGADEFIRVKKTIPQGYALEITTDINERAVRIIAPDGIVTNAMGYIDQKSTFFSLDIGENKLSFITEGGKPDVYVEYRNLYLGV